MKLAVKIVAVVAALLLQVVLAYFLMNWLFDKQMGAQAQPAGDKVEQAADEAEENSERGYEYGALYQLSDLIVNPTGSVGRRLFKISLALEYDPANIKLGDELNARSPFMRDHLITYLGSMNEDQLSDISYRETIRDSLTSALNTFLESGKVDRVLFQDFIRQ